MLLQIYFIVQGVEEFGEFGCVWWSWLCVVEESVGQRLEKEGWRVRGTRLGSWGKRRGRKGEEIFFWRVWFELCCGGKEWELERAEFGEDNFFCGVWRGDESGQG